MGVPSAELGPSAEHVAWQAAHEATVGEVSRAAPGLSHDEREQVAVVLLAERAKEAGEQEAHARWLAHFGGNAPPIARDLLAPSATELLERLRARER